MFRKWFIPTLAVMALTFAAPLDAYAQLSKKGGGEKGGGKSQEDKPSKPEQKGSSDQKGSKDSSPNKGRSENQDKGKSDKDDEKGRSSNDDKRGRNFDISKAPVFQKAQPSRSGAVRYGTSSNLTRPDERRATLTIPEAPKVLYSNRGDRDVFREDRTRAHANYRTGYVQYSTFWNDDCFYYPHYVFDYRPGYCVPSPFYYYSNVPGYVVSTRVQIGNFSFQIYANDRYNWHRPSYRNRDDWYRDNRRYDRRYNDVDYAIDDLVTAFERGRMRNLDDLMPNSGYVQVALEDYANYRMRSDDFYDMMADIVENTDTYEYDVRDVRYERGQVVIYAEHEFRDAYGRRDRKYHTIVLEENRRGYEIAYFRVDRRYNR